MSYFNFFVLSLQNPVCASYTSKFEGATFQIASGYHIVQGGFRE